MKRTICRARKNGRFAKKSACRAFKRGKITIRKTDKAGQFLLILGGPAKKKKARRK